MRRIIWLAALIFIGCSSGEPPSELITLTFKPPASSSFVVELAMLRETTRGDQYNKDSTWTRTAHTQVATGDGYELGGMTDSITMFHNGAQMTDPIVQLFSRADITYLIDTSGQAVDVRGYEEVFASLDTLVGPDTVAAVLQMINPQKLKAQEVNTWNSKFAAYAGRGLKLGEPETDTTLLNLPIEGQVVSYAVTEIIDTVRLNSNKCARLRVAVASDPAELARLTERSLDEIVELFGLTEAIVTRASQRQAASSSVRDWVLEIETMLTHSETSRQEIFFHELSQTGMPVRNQMVESQVKTFTYPEAGETN